jgi:hypothetical protein
MSVSGVDDATRSTSRAVPPDGQTADWNFCADALTQCRVTAGSYRDAAPLSGRAMRIGLDWLERAARIRLDVPLVPSGDEERWAARLSSYSHGLQPPSRFVAIEYEHSGIYDCSNDLTRALSTRRIALCIDLDSEFGLGVDSVEGFERDPNDRGALMVWPITYFDEKNEWEMSPGAAVLPKGQVDLGALRSGWIAQILRDCKGRVASLVGSEGDRDDPMMVVRHIHLLPELCEKLGPPEMAERVIRDTCMDAIWVALGVFSALSCRNVRMDGDPGLPVVTSAEACAPLDPFHGQRIERIWGGAKWEQGVFRGPIFASSKTADAVVLSEKSKDDTARSPS